MVRARTPARNACVALSLVAITIFAPVVVGAVLPDQVWMSGIWDGDDADNLLLLVSDGASVVVARVLLPLHRVSERLAVVWSVPALPFRSVAHPSRSPPFA